MEKQAELLGLMSLLFHLHIPLLQNEIFAYNPLPNVVNILNHSLEVRGCIVGASNEDVVVFPCRCRRVEGRHRNKPRHHQYRALEACVKYPYLS
jgi:hypothetical protein